MLSQIAMTVKGTFLLVLAVHFFAALLKSRDAAWVKGAPLKLFVGLFLIGMWAHSVWIFYLVMAAAIPFFARSRGEAAALYAIVIVAVPVAPYKLVVGGSFLMATSKYLMVMLGLAFTYYRRPGTKQPVGRLFDIPMLIVIVLEISQARDPSLNLTTRQLLSILLDMALPYYYLSRSIETWEDVRRFLIATAMGGFVLAILATAETHLHWLIYKEIEGELHATLQQNAFQQMRGGMLRSPVTFAESTALGNFLALAAVAIAAIRPAFGSRPKFYVALVVTLLGLLAPNSRGAFLGVAIGLLSFDFFYGRWGSLFTKVGTAIGLYLVALIASTRSAYVAEMLGRGAASRGSTEYRALLFKRGMEEIHKHPLLGVPLKQALQNLQDIQQGQHIVDLVNGYIGYGLTLGYLGMIGLAMVFISLALGMLNARRFLKRDPLSLASGALVFSVAVFMAPVVAFTSFGNSVSTYFYEICALGAAVWALRRVPVADKQQGSVVISEPPIRSMILADRAASRTGSGRHSVSESS